MTAIIAASCTFPSGPTLALADIAHRLQFALVRKHPQWADLCQFPIKACFYPELGSSPLPERFRQLIQQVITELGNTLPELKQTSPTQVGILLPPLNRPGVTSVLAAIAEETVIGITGWLDCSFHITHGGRAETITLIDKLIAPPLLDGEFRILLAVDSWLSPDSLMRLDDERLLHNAHRKYSNQPRANPYGRIPSEGAAALVLAPSNTEHRPWCHIRSTGMAVEDVLHSDAGVCTGRGLRKAAILALETSEITSVHHVISDVNGEPYRADELGFTLPALADYLNKECERETPVLATGDLGSASLATHMALTAWRMHASESVGNTLLLSTSDDGQRGAMVMSQDEGASKW